MSYILIEFDDDNLWKTINPMTADDGKTIKVFKTEEDAYKTLELLLQDDEEHYRFIWGMAVAVDRIH
jgi:hypothetical protein|tara:strand:+ start:499 stop:699 length:201 start_codon:yes stop_codon:yes gene_type:complete